MFGTRPEAVKMAPVVHTLRERANFDVRICLSGQHRDMVDHVMRVFDLTADHDADIMQEDQEPGDVVARAVTALGKIFEAEDPDLVLVQGDTTTAFSAALAAFYAHVPTGHIEAGLRTSDRWTPFPEEMNRRLISHIGALHFAPTDRAAKALAAEGIPDSTIFVTGNTVIDALKWLLARTPAPDVTEAVERLTDTSMRTILVTAHRRENLGAPLRAICDALVEIVERNPDVEIVYPVHLNPNVQQVAREVLGDVDRVTLTDPLPYEVFVRVMERSHLVLTDSGGLQEEGPALAKPVLVMREETERPEGVEAGTAKIVGLDRDTIVAETQRLLDDASAYDEMAKAVLPYGDGRAAHRICDAIEAVLAARSS